MQLSSRDGWKPRCPHSCCYRRYGEERQASRHQEAPRGLCLGGRDRNRSHWSLRQGSAGAERHCSQSVCPPRHPWRRPCCPCRLPDPTTRVAEERCWAGRELAPRKAQASGDQCHQTSQPREVVRSHSKAASLLRRCACPGGYCRRPPPPMVEVERHWLRAKCRHHAARHPRCFRHRCPQMEEAERRWP